MIHRRQFLKTSAVALALSSSLGLSARAASKNEIKKGNHMKTQITRIGSQSSIEGPSDWFTGKVRIDPLFNAEDPARTSASKVTFDPGARTDWHTHPLGQTLIITDGCGWVQEEGHPIQEVRPGDVVWFPPQVKHWHGAAAETGMTHIAIHEALDGKVVDWMEKVSDLQYTK